MQVGVFVFGIRNLTSGPFSVQSSGIGVSAATDQIVQPSRLAELIIPHYRRTSRPESAQGRRLRRAKHPSIIVYTWQFDNFMAPVAHYTLASW